MRALLALLAFFYAVSAQMAGAAPRPVVVIPGIMGSKLCDQSNNVIWGDRASYTAGRISALRLPFDGTEDGNGIHSCGLIETVSIIPLLWESNVYAPLLNYLRKLGYGDNDIIVFDYDWRLSNFDNANKLRDFIEKRFPEKSSKVDIVAHSMGGIVTRIYLQTLGGDKRVENVILLGTPQLGSAKIFQRLKEGFEHWPNALSGGLLEIQRVILSFRSTYQLLPAYPDCCAFSASADRRDAEYVDILDPAVWTRFKWLPDEYRLGKGYDFLSKSLATTRQLKSLLANPIITDSSLYSRVHIVANGFLDTWSRVFFDPKDGRIVGDLSFPGDGTVLLFSATNGASSQFQFSEREHETIFVGRAPELAIQFGLEGKTLHSGPAEAKASVIDAGKNVFEVSEASVQLEPRAVPPGGAVSLTLTLKGSAKLQEAVFSNLTAELIRDNVASQTKRLEDGIGAVGPGVRVLKQEFKAPTEPGAYTIRLSVPGMEPFEPIFAVIGP
jgi:pimeloyl-ACP methyl ester carboxylesterase